MLRRVYVVLWVLTVVAALAVTYSHASLRFPRYSDDARIVLEGQDLLQGNWNLRGWILSSDNFWLTEAPVYALGVAIRGTALSLTHDIPGLIYAIVAVLACYLAARPFRGLVAISASLTTFILIGFPPCTQVGDNRVMAATALRCAIHLSTIAMVLLAFLIVEPSMDGQPTAIGLVVGALLLGLAMTSDPLAGWMFWLPAGMVAISDLCHPGKNFSGRASIAWLVGSGVLAGLFGFIEAATHGFTDVLERPVFPTLDDLGLSVKHFVADWLSLFGANFFGLAAHKHTALVLGRFVLLVVTLAALYTVVLAWIKTGTRERWLDSTLSLVVALSAVEFVFSTKGVDGGAQYLIPSVVCASIVAGRRWAPTIAPTWTREGIAKAAALVVGLAVSFASFALVFYQPKPPQPEMVLAHWLINHNLQNGWGSYGDASIVTLDTGGRVSVWPVIVEGDRLVRQPWQSVDRWYTKPPQFVVFGGHRTDPVENAMTLEIAARTLGGAVNVVHLEDYVVVLPDK